MPLLLCFAYFVCCIFATFPAYSAESDDIDDFILTNKTPSYDCPNQSNFSELENIFTTSSLSEKQHFDLSVEKGQFLICNGKYEEAKKLLLALIAGPDVDKSSYFYASAVFQLGFIYDVNEDEQRCDYYTRARKLSSETRHSDIYLSATLAITAYCDKDREVTDRLRDMYRLLYSSYSSQNEAALAHVHNTIGLVYGSELQQYAMAADQYLKSYSVGKEVYEGSNKLSTLISVVIAQLTSGSFDEALDTISILDKTNQEINSKVTNFYYYHALTSYYYRTKEIQKMESVLPKFKEYAQAMNSKYVKQILAWYEVVPCVYNEDINCIQNYLDSGSSLPLKSNLLYNGLVLKMHLLLGDIETVHTLFDEYEAFSFERYYRSQDSAHILGVSNLFSQIEQLESEIKRQESAKQKLLYGGITVAVAVFLTFGFYFRRKYLAQLSIDPTTKLLNSRTTLNRIAKLRAPDEGKTNALALFDLVNFKAINRVVGSTNSEQMLRKIALSFSSVTRETDVLGRFAPEQFALCLHNIEERNARLFFQRVKNALDTVEFHSDRGHPVSVDSVMSIYTTTEKFSDLNAIFDDLQLALDIQNQH